MKNSLFPKQSYYIWCSEIRVNPISLYLPQTPGRLALRSTNSCSFPSYCLPALVAHTKDPPLAAAASNMPVELVFRQKQCFLWNWYWDFWGTGTQGWVLEDKLLMQFLFKLLDCFFNHLLSKLKCSAEDGGKILQFQHWKRHEDIKQTWNAAISDIRT